MTESELKQKIIDKIVELKQLKALRKGCLMYEVNGVIKILEDLLEVGDVQKNKENNP